MSQTHANKKLDDGQHRQREIVRMTFRLSVVVEGDDDERGRAIALCRAWAAEIETGMQTHHFAVDDIDEAIQLTSEDALDDFDRPSWSAEVEILPVRSAVGQQRRGDLDYPSRVAGPDSPQ